MNTTKIEQYIEAVKAQAETLAQAFAGFIPAQGADTVAAEQLAFVRVLSVGEPVVTDEAGNVLASDSFTGGFYGLTKEQRKAQIGVWQTAYDTLKIRCALVGVAGKRAEQLHATLQGLAQIAMGGNNANRKAVREAFQSGPPNKKGDATPPTLGHVQAVVREQIDVMMEAAQTAFKGTDGVVSIATYTAKKDAISTANEKIRTLKKDTGKIRRGLYKAFTNGGRSYLNDARSQPKGLTALEAITTSTDDDMVALAEALAQEGYKLEKITN